MTDWQSILLEPANVNPDGWDGWFTTIANRMLNGTTLWVGGEPHRFTEIEFYYHGDEHNDVFTHRDPIQKQTGHWYFHRTRGVYRGGSFKGIDLTFGAREAFGGVLIRGIEAADGKLIDGPSLTVDHLLARTKSATVADLDGVVGGRSAWEKDLPLRIEMTEMKDRPLLRTARVGLSLKRLRNSPLPPAYIMKPYRFLSEPKRIAKGKVHMVLALHAKKHTPEQINQLCGCPKGTVQRYVLDYEVGKQETDFGPYFGIDLGNPELCKLTGLWQAKYGPPAPPDTAFRGGQGLQGDLFG